MPPQQPARRSRIGLAALLILAALLVGSADFLTGAELAFSVFYLFPIGLAAWYVNRRAGALISVVSAVAWYLADTLARTEPYSYPLIPAWNAGTRLITFFAVTTLTATLRDTLGRESTHARVDYLTGAANTRAFYEAAEIQISTLRRYGRPFSLLYLDIDDLKRVNDMHGHSAGDRVLRDTVASLNRTLRRGDTLARLGGDEFAVLLAEADRPAAEVASARIQEALRRSPGGHYHVTFSVGGLTCLEAPRSVDELIERADSLMYEAKRGGKDALRLATYGEAR
jgi:diguanylate cyclase (GGDEF)-like protein